MALQGPHQVAKKSTTIRVPVSARAESKSALLWDVSVASPCIVRVSLFFSQALGRVVGRIRAAAWHTRATRDKTKAG
jgi:hypothetical protein